MKKKSLSWMLGIALTLASCGQEDMLTQSSDKGLGEATFSVSMNTGMQTRAVTDATDEAPTRCIVEVYTEDGTSIGQYTGVSNETGFDVTVPKLNSDLAYTFVFWADGGEGTYDATSLKAVSRSTNPGIAFYHVLNNFTPNGTEQAITLTHAVAKIVMNQTTNDLATGDKVGLIVYMPKTINVFDGCSVVAADGTPKIASETIIGTTLQGPLNSIYTFVYQSTAQFTLSYLPSGADEGSKEIVYIYDVPVKRNYRTVISGDFGKLSKTTSFTASLDGNWDENLVSNTVDGNEITRNSVLSASQITEALAAEGNTERIVKIKGALTDADLIMLSEYGANNDNIENFSLDLSQSSFSATPDREYGSYFLKLKSIILPSSCKTIGTQCFRNASNLESIVADGVETIKDYAFHTSGLVSINFPELTKIERSAFSNCKSMTSANLPKVNSIMGDAFSLYSDVAITIKLTCAGPITIPSYWLGERKPITVSLFLNPDKRNDAEGDATPKVDAEGQWITNNKSKPWDTFNSITYEEPSSTFE